jgi:hypothetical protein
VPAAVAGITNSEEDVMRIAARRALIAPSVFALALTLAPV